LPTRAVIPEFLCGMYPQVRSKVRALLRKAQRVGNLRQVISESDLVHIDDTPWHIVLDKPRPSFDLDAVIPWPVFNEIWERLPHQDFVVDYQNVKALIWESLPDFWFSLAVMSGSAPLPGRGTRFDPVECEDLAIVLRALLRWWPEICRLERRFVMGSMIPMEWPHWGGALWNILNSMDRHDVVRAVQDADPLDVPHVLGPVISRWVSEDSA
jgi:hypothetical protein